MNKKTVSLIESQLIACLFEDGSKISQFSENYFLTETGQHIFLSILDVLEKGLSITVINVLKEVGKYNSSLTQEIVEYAKTIEYDIEEFNIYLQELIKAFYFQKFNNTLIDKAFIGSGKKSTTIKEMQEITDELIDAMNKINNSAQSYKLYSASEEMDAIEKQVDEKYLGLNKNSSGCIHLDSILYNQSLNGGELSVITASSGSGKTSFITWLVEQRRWKNLPTLAINLEMSFDSVMINKMAIRSRVEKRRFSFPDEDIKDDDYKVIKKAIDKEKIKASRINKYKYLDTPSLSIDKFISILQQTKKELGLKKNDFLLCVIDLATMIEDFNSGANGSKANDYEYSENRLLEIAKEYNTHIVQIVQIKRPKDKIEVREAEDVDKLAPTTEQLKNSGALEERARVVISVFRRKFFLEKYLGIDHPITQLEEDIMQVKILKQNNERVGTQIDYLFHPTTGLLHKYDPPIIPEVEENE